MSQQNKLLNTSNLANLPVKRKRGRPRKDDNLVQKNRQLHVTPTASDGMRIIQHGKVDPSNDRDGDIVGQVVSGVIEGTFDAGYFLSVRIGNNTTPLRGVVFLPGQFTPITAANDVAPQVKMYTRRDFPLPVLNPKSQVNGSVSQPEQNIRQPVQIDNKAPTAPDQNLSSELQSSAPFALKDQSASVMAPLTNMPKNESGASLRGIVTLPQNPEFGFENQPAPPLKNIRMVEKDDMMQVFEVSTQLEGPKSDVEAAKDGISESASEQMVDIFLDNETIYQVSQDQNRTVQCEIKQGELVHNEMKSPNLEFHQTPLVAKPQSVTPEPHSAESGLKPSELVHNEVKSLNFKLPQTPAVAEPQSVPPEPISESMDIVMEKPISPNMQSEIADNVLRKNEASQNEKAGSDAAVNTKVGSQTTPRTVEATPSIPELDFVLQDAIPPTQSPCYPSSVSETENR